MNFPAAFHLIRIGNCLIAVSGVWVGAYLTVGFRFTFDLWAAMAGAFLICAGGNVVNDIIDLEFDRINHPARPLPSGKLSVKIAIVIAWGCHLLAVPLILLSNWSVMVIGMFCMAALLAYNLWLKRLPLVGNLVVGVLGGLIFLCGGLAVDVNRALQVPGPLVAAVFALLFHLIREFIKDIEDIEGDKLQDVRSLARLAGPRATLAVALGLFVLLASLTLVPVWLDWYGQGYLLIVILLIDLPLLCVLLLTYLRPSREHIEWSRVGLKIGMLLGLVALLVA